MNPKNKKVLAGAAVAGVLVIWIPQLVASGDDAPAPTALAPAVSGSLVVVRDISSMDETPTESGGTNTAAAGTDPVDPAEALEKRLGFVKAFLPERSQRDLDVLAAAWSLEIEDKKPKSDEVDPDGVESARPSVVVVPVGDGSTASDAPKREEASSTDPLDAFLAANPLTGVLYGEDLRVANLGSSVVREGDDLFGIARVEAIGPRWIVLERGSRHVRVDLVPLTARAKGSTTGSTTGAPSATGATAGSAGPGVAVSATPVTAKAAGEGTTAAKDLEALLSGMQQALGTLGAAAATDTKSGSKEEKGKKP